MANIDKSKKKKKLIIIKIEKLEKEGIIQ